MSYKQFEITGKCNLSCRACYNKELMKSLGDIEIKSVLKYVSAGDVVYLGGGEPMIHPGIQELVEKLVNIPTEVVIATNATIYKKMPQQAQIQISVWTLNPSLYNHILGGTGNQLKKVKKNIGMYIADGNPVFLNMPIYEENFGDLDTISDYADLLCIPLRVNPVSPANGISNSAKLERKIEDSIFMLKLSGRNIIYSKNKQPVERYYLKC